MDWDKLRAFAATQDDYYIFSFSEDDDLVDCVLARLDKDREKAIEHYVKHYEMQRPNVMLMTSEGEVIAATHADKIGMKPFDELEFTVPSGSKPQTKIHLVWRSINKVPYYQHDFL